MSIVPETGAGSTSARRTARAASFLALCLVNHLESGSA